MAKQRQHSAAVCAPTFFTRIRIFENLLLRFSERKYMMEKWSTIAECTVGSLNSIENCSIVQEIATEEAQIDWVRFCSKVFLFHRRPLYSIHNGTRRIPHLKPLLRSREGFSPVHQSLICYSLVGVATNHAACLANRIWTSFIHQCTFDLS